MSKIIPTKYYSVNQIAKNGWIFGLAYEAVRSLVLNNRLKAIRHYGKSDGQVRYRILGQDILKYIKKEGKR